MEERRKTQKEKIQEITEEIERGVVDFFENSDSFKEWIAVCSRFHKYSLNNTILITLQCPSATLVAGFARWKEMGRYVKKGEHGIRILAPYKYHTEVENVNGEKEMIERIGFKPAYIYDVSQTEGKELPSLGVSELTGDVKEYRRFFRALTQISPVSISFEEIEGGAKGYYTDAEKRIVIQQGMSQLQTIKTLVHEICHSVNHNKEALKDRPALDRMSMEVESEAVALTVLKAFDLDSEGYSIPYIGSYSSRKDVKELKACMESIRSTADEMMKNINQSLKKQRKREKTDMEMER